MDRIQKLLYFRYFFTGRDDVFAVRQSDGRYTCVKAKLTDGRVIKHLQGREIVGSYPLLQDSTTRWVAADFDNKNGNAFKDAWSLVEALRKFDIEPLCNTSQSGKGVHVRLIFLESGRNVDSGHDIKAAVARRFMEAMVEYAELKRVKEGGAFDRVFPNCDTWTVSNPFGNQIAMPLNKFAAEDRNGTMLLDREFRTIPLGDATWDRIELYDRISSGTVFDAVQSMGKFGSVYGNHDENGHLIYDNDKDVGYIRSRYSKDGSKPTADDFDFVKRNCNFFRSVEVGTIPYIVWIGLCSIVAVFDHVGGRGEFHRISSLDGGSTSRGKPRYDPVDTDSKYDNISSHFRSPVTCEYLAGEGWVCGHLGEDGMCNKFRLTDGRGPRTPATVYCFRKALKGQGGTKATA